MRPSLFVRCLLFISSYFPLALIFCFVLFDKQRSWALVALLVGLTGLIGLALYFGVFARRKPVFHEKVTGFQRRDGDIMSYIASYLIPFVTFSLVGWQQIATLGVFILVLSVLYVTSNMIYINPVLSFIGYHLYEVTLENSELSHYLITRHKVVRGRTICVVRIGEEAFLEVRKLARCQK